LALEDFTTYVEVDPNGNIIISSDGRRVTQDAYMDEYAYVYKDKGQGHFTDFEHDMTIYVDSFGQTRRWRCYWMLANAVGGMTPLYESGEDYLSFKIRGETNQPQIFIMETTNYTEVGDMWLGEYDTPYYITIKKDCLYMQPTVWFQ